MSRIAPIPLNWTQFKLYQKQGGELLAKLGKELLATEIRLSSCKTPIPVDDSNLWTIIEIATCITDNIELSTNMVLSATSYELGIHEHNNAKAFFDTGNDYCSVVNKRYKLHQRAIVDSTLDVYKGLNAEGVLARLEEVDMKASAKPPKIGSFGQQLTTSVSEVNTGWGDSVGPMRSVAGRNQIRSQISKRMSVLRRRQEFEGHAAWNFTVAVIRTMLRGLAQHFFGVEHIPDEWNDDLYGPRPMAPSEFTLLAKRLETPAFTPQQLFRPEADRA